MRPNESKQHFSIRKLTIGVASVLIGTTFYLTSGQTVHADTTNDAANQITVSEQTSQNDKNADATTQKQTTNTNIDQQTTTTSDTANLVNTDNSVTTPKNVPNEKDIQKDEGVNNNNSVNSIAPSTPSAKTRELKAQDNKTMNVTINVVNQDEDNKVIASQVWSNVPNGGYAALNVPNAGNYYSTGGTQIDGVTFAGSYWVSFTNKNCDWTHPNIKWDAGAADKLNGQTLDIYVKNVKNENRNGNGNGNETEIENVTINVVDQDDNDKVIASQVWSNPGNGKYTTLNVPNAGNYYSTGSTQIDGVTFAGSYWASFTDKNCDWTHPNLKWDTGAADKLNGQTLDIYVKHRTANVSYTDPNAKRTITETINVTNPDGSKQAPVVRSVTFDRTATKDLVTGNVSYGDWNEASQTFASYDVPAIKGYTPSQATIPAQTVKPGDPDLTFNITYTKDAPIGIKADAENPATKTITRTITFEGVTLDPVVQQVEFSRIDKNGNIGYQDAATGEITYNAWTPENSTFPGYKPAIFTKGIITYVPATTEVPSETVTPSAKDETVTVTYYSHTTENESAESSQDALAVIIYQDEAGNTVSTQTQAGQPGVQVKLEVPAGYHIVGTTPDVVITADMKPVTVVIAPDDSGNTDGGTIPNTPDTPSTTPTNPSVPEPNTPNSDSENNSNTGKKPAPVKKHGKHGSSTKTHVLGISNNRSKSSSDVKAASVNADSSKKFTNGNDNELPQTGENESSTTSSFGLLALALGGLMGFAGDRKKKRS